VSARAVLVLSAALVATASGILAVRAARSAESRPARAPEAAAPEPETEPDRARTRTPIRPLAQEKLVAAAAGVEVRWAKLNKEAIDTLESGEEAKAVERFERCVAAVPGEPVFAANLAEALARLAAKEDSAGSAEDRARSREHLERAAKLAPGRKDIQERLAQLTRLDAAEKGFTTEPSQHFELAYDGARTDLTWSTADLTRILENAYQDLGELFGFWPVEAGRPRIRVVVYGKSGFHEATGMGHWAVGAFDGSVRVPVEDLKKEKAGLERVLRHEVTHYFVREAGGSSVPGWLNEGLAQWCESAYVLDRARSIDAAKKRLAGKELAPLDKLAGVLGRDRTDEEIAVAYAEALALCGWIESSFGERLLFDLVAAEKSGEGWRPCFRRRTGVDPDTAVVELAR
jgi:hypothetical protein